MKLPFKIIESQKYEIISFYIDWLFIICLQQIEWT